jgi:hypothetical protein
MIEDILVLDNAIPKADQEELKHLMFNTRFPWYYFGDLGGENEKLCDVQYDNAVGFAHLINNLSDVYSDYSDKFLELGMKCCSSLNIFPTEILRCRTFYQHPYNGSVIHNGLTKPHIDDLDRDHMVLIYYVFDSDGDTVLFNKTQNNKETGYEISEKDIFYRMKPRQGSVLAFNGKIYHANILPKESQRCIINYNFKL